MFFKELFCIVHGPMIWDFSLKTLLDTLKNQFVINQGLEIYRALLSAKV